MKRLGGKLAGEDWAIGVTLYQVQFGDEALSVFVDPYSVDIEGSDELVKRILAEWRRARGITAGF